jgi:hypothetical protein
MRILSKRQLKELVLYSPQHIARLEKVGQFPRRVQLGTGLGNTTAPARINRSTCVQPFQNPYSKKNKKSGPGTGARRISQARSSSE